MRTYAIGDIHGCYHTLVALMNKLPLTSEDKIIFLGDYIDRGPHSKQVVQFVKELTESNKAIALRGNHEQMCVDYYNGSGYWGQVWQQNGGGQTLDSYDTRTEDEMKRPSYIDRDAEADAIWKANLPQVSKEHIEWMKNLPFRHVTDNFIFVHAGMIPGKTVGETSETEQDMLWIRNEFIKSNYDWGKIVVYGHTPDQEVNMQPNKVGLDTACVYGNKLTAMCMESGIVYSALHDDRDTMK